MLKITANTRISVQSALLWNITKSFIVILENDSIWTFNRFSFNFDYFDEIKKHFFFFRKPINVGILEFLERIECLVSRYSSPNTISVSTLSRYCDRYVIRICCAYSRTASEYLLRAVSFSTHALPPPNFQNYTDAFNYSLRRRRLLVISTYTRLNIRYRVRPDDSGALGFAWLCTVNGPSRASRAANKNIANTIRGGGGGKEGRVRGHGKRAERNGRGGARSDEDNARACKHRDRRRRWSTRIATLNYFTSGTR